MSKLHDYLKSQENLITASVDGKTLLDFIDRNAEEYPDYPALNTPANSEYGIQYRGQKIEMYQKI